MPLEDIFIQEMDRATSRLETVRINPTRQFLAVPLGPDGRWVGSPALYWWQNGAWYDTGGTPMDPEAVPQKFRDEIRDNPVHVTQAKQPAVTWVCQFCGERMNSSEQEGHLIKHVNDTMAAAGTMPKTEVLVSKLDPPSAKADANRHRG